VTRYATRDQVLRAHAACLAATGGTPGIRDDGLLDSAIAAPKMTWGADDLYPTLPAKAAALAFSLIANHPFVDGNKRIGYVMAVHLLESSGWELSAELDERAGHPLRRSRQYGPRRADGMVRKTL